MDYNVTVMGGRLAARPELLEGMGHPSAMRLLVEVKSDFPRVRHDLVPVVHLGHALGPSLHPGDRVWVVGSLQRRFSPTSGHGRLEVVASYVAAQQLSRRNPDAESIPPSL